ncbi:MAG: hypothetical protein WD826_12390 [Actinomycetota bacterium]
MLPAPAAEAASTTKVNFDVANAPCSFNGTIALRRYKTTTFTGPTVDGGGAILGECASFGVTGHSPPNFLAFNLALLADGGSAMAPEKITFPKKVRLVKVKAGSASGGDITMEAFRGPDGTGTSLGSSTLMMGSAVAALKIQKGRNLIKSVVISTPTNNFVLDDLVTTRG